MSDLKHLIIYDFKVIDSMVRKRKHEIKLGEKIQTINTCNSLEELETQLKESEAKFVLIGLPEDIGVKANYGRGGAYSAWLPTLDNLLNIQSNAFFSGQELLVLGHINFEDLLNSASSNSNKTSVDIDNLRNLTTQIDQRVNPIINSIIKAKKTLIVIGGGHNNSYPIIKGASLALNRSINVVNIDPHSDFRPLEGRHSGNGFSYAFNEKYLEHYTVVGLHESYNSENIIADFNSNDALEYFTYEDIVIREKISFDEVIESCNNFSKNHVNGLEVDLDAIQNIPSSAKTSSGFLPVDVRKFITKYAAQSKPVYIHIAEGAPVLSHIKTDNKTGKLIAYLVSDFVKAVRD